MSYPQAQAAFQAMIPLVQTPRQTVKLLEQKIPPAAKPALAGRTVTQWIDDLGSDNFTVANGSYFKTMTVDGGSGDDSLNGGDGQSSEARLTASDA